MNLPQARVVITGLIITLASASAALAQSRARVNHDHTLIWRADVNVVAASVPAGTELDVVGQVGTFYQVIVPTKFGGHGEIGRIAASAITFEPGSAPPPVRPGSDPAPPPERTPDDGATADEAPKKPGPGAIGFAGVGLFAPDARDSFDAVGITGNPLVFGGGVEATRVYRQLFIRGAADWSQETGERVFLDDTGGRYPLGIPLDVRMVPIDFTAGWRFDGHPGTRRRVVPYVGGGTGVLLYRESDEFEEDDETVDDTFLSYHVLGGVDVYLQPRVALRAEFRYRAVPDALGESGVSAITGDTSLGGAVFFVGLAFGR